MFGSLETNIATPHRMRPVLLSIPRCWAVPHVRAGLIPLLETTNRFQRALSPIAVSRILRFPEETQLVRPIGSCFSRLVRSTPRIRRPNNAAFPLFVQRGRFKLQ